MTKFLNHTSQVRQGKQDRPVGTRLWRDLVHGQKLDGMNPLITDRAQLLAQLASVDEYDVAVIGGGATGFDGLLQFVQQVVDRGFF
jgi:hypothetical protein